jgi:hypothetical protein
MNLLFLFGLPHCSSHGKDTQVGWLVGWMGGTVYLFNRSTLTNKSGKYSSYHQNSLWG